MTLMLALLFASPALAVQPAPTPAPAAATARGLWIGPLQLCRGTVESVATAVDKFTLERVVLVTFRPLMQPRLEQETARHLGRVMPVRLHGLTISEPRVNEPIAGLQLQIGPMPEKFASIRQAAAGPCSAAQRRPRS